MQYVQIVVKDTGIGIEQQFLPHLFDKFTQEDRSIVRKYGGTGLGMSICRQLTQLMQGDITVRSRKGAGTEMTLTIPFTIGSKTDLPSGQSMVTDSSILRDKHILLVEDNEINRLVANTVLNHYGARVTEACNGAEALDLLHKQSFSIVLMDIQMPVMDGLEATRNIRHNISSTLPVIALTANAIKGENEKCIAAGMNDYVSKPFEEEILIQTISRWLDKAYLPDVKPAGTPAMDITESSSLYDLGKLQHLARGNDAFVDKMISLFLQQMPSAIDRINKAAEENDTATIKAIAHKIKPVLENMGCRTAENYIQLLESCTLAHQEWQQIKDAIRRLAEIVLKVSDGLTAVQKIDK